MRDTYCMRSRRKLPRDTRDIFERLKSRGIGPKEYEVIKQIVWLDLPHSALFLQRHLGHRSPQQVLQQVVNWRQFLSSDFLLPEGEKEQVEKSVECAELIAWNSLVEGSFPRLGSWALSRQIRVVERKGNSPKAVQRITASRYNTGQKEPAETRTAVIVDHTLTGKRWCTAWRKAFEDLGLLDLVLKDTGHKRLVSARGPQAWPVFTQSVIPKLYEYLIPYYPKPGHVWSTKESTLRRNALFPQELLQDMLDILHVEHQDAFESTDIGDLKSVVYRYVAQKRESSKSAKRPQI